MDLTALLMSRLQFASDVPLTPLHLIVKDAIFRGKVGSASGYH